MGAGIWSMHFVGMLAYKLPIPMRYELLTTLASMVVAIVTPASRLQVVTRGSLSWHRLLSERHRHGRGHRHDALHRHGGDAARRARDVCTGTFALSVVNAIVCSTVALWLVFRLGGVQHRATRCWPRWSWAWRSAACTTPACIATVCVSTGPTRQHRRRARLRCCSPLSIAVITLLIMRIGAHGVAAEPACCRRRCAKQNERLLRPRSSSAAQGGSRTAAPSRQPAGAGRGTHRRTDRRARRGGIGEPRQEPVPGQHEPRNPHADERRASGMTELLLDTRAGRRAAQYLPKSRSTPATRC